MIKTLLSIRNPFARDKTSRFSWDRTLTLSRFKHFETQVWHGSPYDLFALEIDLGWRGHDHAGPNLLLGVYGFELTLKIYDSRHWDYEKGTWANPHDPHQNQFPKVPQNSAA